MDTQGGKRDIWNEGDLRKTKNYSYFHINGRGVSEIHKPTTYYN